MPAADPDVVPPDPPGHRVGGLAGGGAPRVRGVPRTPPGPRGSLLLGMARDLQRDQLGTLERAMTTYGDVVRLDAGPPGRRYRMHLVTHPDGVQQVLAGGAANYVKDTRFYREMAAVLGDGLLTSDGQRWRRQRRTLAPLFPHHRIGGYVPVMAGAQFALTEAVVAIAVLLTTHRLRTDAAPVPLAAAITLRPAGPVWCEALPRQPAATAPAAAPRSPGRT